MSDLSEYAAEEIANWLSQGTVASPPDPIYVTLYDDEDNELDGDLENGRVETTADDDWDIINTNDFENNSEINFGDATADITVEDVALFDSDTGGSDNELARYAITDAPRDVSDGTRVFFDAGELSFDVLDRTE